MMWNKMDVYKITEIRGGAVYRTKKLGSIWLPATSMTVLEENAIAEQYGGDKLSPCMGPHFGPTPPWEGMR